MTDLPRADGFHHPSLSPVASIGRNLSPTAPGPRPQMPGNDFFEATTNTSGAANGRKRGRDSGAMNGGDRRSSEKTSSPPLKDKDGSSKDAPPSILVREKKQKACSNCRRAKLKCIVEENQTDCVRCCARKEKCIFYPRGHDEDWQQTLTSDMYSAIGHLAHLSAAVHHILDHLTSQGAVPPFEPPLPRFEAPDRDLAVIQGWTAERNRALGADGGRKRRKGVKKEEDDEDDERELSEMPQFVADYPAVVPPGVVRPADMHTTQQQRFERISSTTDLSFSSGVPQIPLSEVDIGFSYALPPTNGRADSTLSAGPDTQPSGTGITPDALNSISPVDNTFSVSIVDSGTPSSQIRQGQGYPSQQGIFGLLNGPRSNASPSSAIVAPVPNMSDTLGSADPRPNIVKRGLLPNTEALGLVNYFHAKLGQWMFGYRLEFGKFPYIPQGPSVITPFILSVMCLVASERVGQAHEHRPLLAREVTQLLINSPADSFISTLDPSFGGGSRTKDEDGEEELDPELGIGPEEIVGACILATFMTERDQAATIASSAFKWARGWIKWTSLTVPLPPTLGEVCGLLPIKRDATREDMARVWLLCYIVDGTEALQRDNPPPPRRDPMAYCHVLVPDSPLPGDRYSPHDILLTFHARLITLLRDWYHRRSQHGAAVAGSNVAAQVGAHARLASSINASLEWWRADLESHQLDPNWMRHINLFWEFARMLVNVTSAKSLGGNPRLRAAAWAHGVEAAVGFLEKCNAWPQKEELSSLPPCYLSMITLAGSVLVDAIKDQGVAECPFQSEEAIPLLNNVSDMLAGGGLPPSHVARTAGQTLRGYSEQLAQFS